MLGVRHGGAASNNSGPGFLAELPAVGEALAGGTVAYSGTSSSFVDSGLDIGELYYYRVYPYRAVYTPDLNGNPVLVGLRVRPRRQQQRADLSLRNLGD